MSGTVPFRLLSGRRGVHYAIFLVLVVGSLIPLPARAQTVEKASSSRTSSRKLITQVQPEYPSDLKHARIGGMVRLNIVVSPRGTVDFVEVAGGNPILAESASRAVKQWKYAPASSSSNIRVNIHFDPYAQ
jgi:TonB family protein